MRRVRKPPARRSAAREHAHVPRVTTRAAAESMKGVSGRQRLRVLRAIEAAGRRGMTDEEVCDELGINPSSERPRRGELLDSGLITESGKTRRTKSGRQATVWVAT